MCQMSQDVPDTSQLNPPTGDAQPSEFDSGSPRVPNAVAGPSPTKKVPTKFGTFMKYAMPTLQGALYGLGSRQPQVGTGGQSFGSAFGSSFERVQNRAQQLGMMRYQMALEQMDRQLRLATLQNTQAYQKGRLGIAGGNLEARLQAIENKSDEQDWGPPVQVDDPNDETGTRKLLIQSEKKTGRIRPVLLPGQGGAESMAPMTPGGAGGGATPAGPSVPGADAGMGLPLAMGPQPAAPSGPPLTGPGMGPATTGGIANAFNPFAPSTTTNAPAPKVTPDTVGQATRTGKARNPRGKVNEQSGIPISIYGDNDKIWRTSDPGIPDDLKAQLKDAQDAHAQDVKEKKDIAASGRAAGQTAKPTTQYDTQLGIVRTVSAGEAEANPGRYRVASYNNIIDSQQKLATIKELDTNIKRVNDSADAIKGGGLDPNLIAAGLADPSSNLGQQFQGMAVGRLNPKQRDVINFVRNLRQGAASYKNILSSGGVTDARLNLLEQELPGVQEIASGDPKVFRQKLKAWTDIYNSVRDQYKGFFENMLGQSVGEGPNVSGNAPNANVKFSSKKAPKGGSVYVEQ